MKRFCRTPHPRFAHLLPAGGEKVQIQRPGEGLPILILTLLIFAACSREDAGTKVPGNPTRGRQLIAQYGCNVCHITPGVDGPRGTLGPSLEGIASRPTISDGTVPNTPEAVVMFIQSPRSMNPTTAMPAMNVSTVDAQDITAFLMTLK